MAQVARFCLSLFFLPLFCYLALRAEDIKLREQAVQLLERANAASLIGGLRDYEQSIAFTFYDPLDGSAKTGSFTRTSAGSAGRRDEFTYGDYRAATVLAGDLKSSTRKNNEPPEIVELLDQLPIYLGRFDEKDAIRSIHDSNIVGQAAKCINFDTYLAMGTQANQICLDLERGTLLRWQVGNELIENSDFFQVANLWEPGHIRHFVRGGLRVEIEQRITRTPSPVDVSSFSPPSGKWQKWHTCQNRRRAVGVSMPMPQAGTEGTGTVDVVVRGYIWDTGKVQPLTIVSSLRPDLNEEAKQVVATWKFTPLMCNDEPATTIADFVVHFQGR